MSNCEDMNIVPKPGAKIETKELQHIMLGVLTTFAGFCEKNQLRYYLDAGTLLGAIRHKGFIPWDNDVDVGMPREDYNRLLLLMEGMRDQLDENIVIERPENTIYSFLKIGDRRTRLIEFPEKNPIECYAYIDVFPQDGIRSLNRRAKMVCWMSEKLSLLHWFCKYSIPCWKKNSGMLKRFVAYTGDLLLRDKQCGYRLQMRLINRYIKRNPFDQCAYGTTLVNGEYQKCAPIAYCTRTVDYPFEGRMFKIPETFDEYLTALYGKDYMTPPPEDKRWIHNIECYWR